MSDYKRAFYIANERNHEFNLECFSLDIKKDNYINKEFHRKLPALILENFGAISVEEVSGRCFEIHARLKNVIERILECTAYFTLGNVFVGNDRVFEVKHEELKKLLTDGISSSKLNMHAWITLNSMEILDFSIASTYAIAKGTNEGIGSVIANHPDDLSGGLKYVPMIIGDEFLYKIGAKYDL